MIVEMLSMFNKAMLIFYLSVCVVCGLHIYTLATFLSTLHKLASSERRDFRVEKMPS